MEDPTETQWIAARLAALAPAWEPDVVRARARIRAAAPPKRHVWRYGLAAAAAAVVVAAIAPSGRALAQELWYRWFVTRVAVVRLDLSRIPLDTSVRTDGMTLDASSPDDAARKAGYAPFVLPVDAVGTAPTLRVVGRIDATQTIRTPQIEAALRREGVTDVVVPPEWNGLALRASIGPIVAATYPGEIEILQAPPVRLETPASFPLARFVATVFRAAGLPPHEATRLGAEFAAHPAWLLDVPADEAAVVETVSLPGGSGLLIEDADESGGARVTVIVSRPARIYSVSSPSRAESLRLAAMLP